MAMLAEPNAPAEAWTAKPPDPPPPPTDCAINAARAIASRRNEMGSSRVSTPPTLTVRWVRLTSTLPPWPPELPVPPKATPTNGADRGRRTAVAAATADALHEQAVQIVAGRRQGAGEVGGDQAAVASRGAAAADGQQHAAGRTAVAAATADRLACMALAILPSVEIEPELPMVTLPPALATLPDPPIASRPPLSPPEPPPPPIDCAKVPG